MTLQRQSQFYKLHISVFDVTYFFYVLIAALILIRQVIVRILCVIYTIDSQTVV